ncbi:tRNA pseudouridine synthase B, partial [Bifidobacterium bifidum]
MGTVPEASGGEQAPIVASEAAPVAGSAAPATPTSGLLVVDKPRGVTSHDIVAAARGALHMKKVGHAGTLDPMATGVLVVGFGNATRLLNHIVEHDKTYEATIRLGQSTTTDDADGELLSATSPERWQELLALPVAGGPQSAGENGPVNAAKGSAVATAKVADDGSAYHPHQEAFLPDCQQLWRDRIGDIIALQLTGSIEQVPNTFSAIKINGQRAYDLARDGKDVQLKARRITVSAFGVLDVRFGYAPTRQLGLPLVSAADGRATTERDDAEATPVIDVDVRVSCSAGTYIRALGRDLGAALGVGGHLIRLRRTRVGGFD